MGTRFSLKIICLKDCLLLGQFVDLRSLSPSELSTPSVASHALGGGWLPQSPLSIYAGLPQTSPNRNPCMGIPWELPSEVLWVGIHMGISQGIPVQIPMEIPTRIPTGSPMGIPMGMSMGIPTVIPMAFPLEFPQEFPWLLPREFPGEYP